MDVDYTVFENTKTGRLHLSIESLKKNTKRTTICGLPLKMGKFLHTAKMTTKAFWKSDKSCKNCTRAAKH